MTALPALEYRISGNGGIVFVRELIQGAIIARLHTANSPRNPQDVVALVGECEQFFEAPVTSFEHDGDCVRVVCKIGTNTAT